MKEIMGKITKRAAGLFIGGGLIVLIAGSILFFFSFPHLFGYLFKSKPDLFEASSQDYEEDAWFSCNNNILFDYYCSDNYGRYYITATNDGKYFGFYVRDKDVEKADRITEQTYAVYDGKADSFSDEFISGKGYFKPMDASEKKYFVDFFEYYGNSIDEYDVIYYNYRITSLSDVFFSDDGKEDTFHGILGLICIVAGLAMIIYFICGGYKRQYKKSLDKYGILPEVLERDMSFSSQIDNAYIGTDHVIFTNASGANVFPFNALVWVYLQVTTTQHTTYGIKTGTTKSYSVILWDRYHKKNIISMKNEDNARKVIETMFERAPYFFTGYSDELANYTDNGQFDSMVRAVDERRMHVTDNQTF